MTVTLKDQYGNPVSGKTVTLGQGAGASTISAASGPSSATGVVTFTVKDSTAQTVTYTTDVGYDGSDSFTYKATNSGGDSNVATITITDNETAAVTNPIDTSDFFVHQHYIDFLGREPDASG